MKLSKISKNRLVLTALAFGILGLVGTFLTHADTGVTVGNPYIDPAQISSLTGSKISLYAQPWRGYMETVPATTLLGGMGVNYNPVHSTAAQDDANLQYLASIGVHAIRVELPWVAVSPTDETKLTASSTTKFNAIFAACKKYGIVPTVLLNAHHGAPEPAYTSYNPTVVGSPQIGDSQVTVTGIAAANITVHQPGTSTGASGITLGNLGEAGNLITGMTTDSDGSLTLTLSQPLAAVPAGGKVRIDYLKYLPLYPVGTAEFNNTMTGWNQYVKTATNTVGAAGITNYSVEIWNELTFGSKFLNINNYYPANAKLYPTQPEFLHSGGSSWKMGNQTVQYLKNTYGNNVKSIWGFSNTTFFHTAINALPPDTGGESYHPYGTNSKPLYSSTDQGSSIIQTSQLINLREGTYVPDQRVAIPEGANALGFGGASLIRGKLQPSTRQTAFPPGTTNFSYYITETGLSPGQLPLAPGAVYPAGFDQAENQKQKAKAFLREYSFWLNKGIDQFDVFAAFDNTNADRGWNMLATGSDVSGSPITQQAQAIQNFSAQFAGATTPTSPRNLGVTVTDVTANDSGPAYQVFPADSASGESSLHYREMFQFLPFQVTNKKFVIPTYVMSWNLNAPPPPMDFQVDVSNINGTNATASYYDPITNTAQPITIVNRSNSHLVLKIQAVDYPRTITIDEDGTTPPPPDTTAPDTTITDGPNSSTASGASFSFTSSEANSTFECKLDNGSYAACTSPKTYANLAAGSHTFSVRATDSDDNVDATPATHDWTIISPPDTTDPAVSFSSPANNATVSGTVTATAAATDTSGITKVEISLDGSPKMTDTNSPYNYSFDSKLLTNGSHTLSAKAYDAAGNTATATITVNVNNPDITPPNTPTGLNATAGSPTTVSLSWTTATDPGISPSGVVKYNVLRNGTVIAQPTTNSYTDTGRTANTTYTYTVQAVDAANNVSASSGSDSATTPSAPDTTPPTIPVSLEATLVSITQVNLTWTASTDSGGSGIAGYNIYRGGTKLNSSPVTTTSYGDSTVADNTTYNYKVEAVDGAGNKSAQTAAASITIPALVRGDVTGSVGSPDGKIDIYDLSYIIRNYGRNDARGDVSGPAGSSDGKIDIYDISYEIRNYGK